MRLWRLSALPASLPRFAVVALGLGAAVLTPSVTGCSGADAEAGSQDEAVTTNVVANKDAFFTPETMYFVRIKGWDESRMAPSAFNSEQSTRGSELFIYKTKADSARHCPDAEVGDQQLVYKTKAFTVRTSGNMTNGTPKSSYKLSLEDDDDRLFKMKSLNLKSMWNDVSQMREAVAWDLFAKAAVPAPRHVYAKFCINNRYYGLYSLIEQVDKPFLKDHFGKNDEGNLYKAYWEDIGPATLEHRKDASGDDSGKQYFRSSTIDNRTHQLKTNDKDSDPAEKKSYDDLAAFVRVLNGVGLPASAGQGDARFNSPEYKAALDGIFDTKAFLRWASVNMLLGAWDNYWATPANYYLYNSGFKGAQGEFVGKPYFHWVPWDYDNALGIDRFRTEWQYADLLDWEKSTRNYNGGSRTSKTPLITNMLKNDAYVAYYLDHLEWMVDTYLNDMWITGQLGDDNLGTGIWGRVRRAAFLEANSAREAAHTGRQFTNDQVYWNGIVGNELDFNGAHILGIKHFVRMRHDSAKEQLARLRRKYPQGSSGATFPPTADELPRPPQP